MSVYTINWVLRGNFKSLGLSSGDKFVAMALADWSDDEGGNIYPSLGAIERRTEHTRRTIQRSLRKLEAAGVLVADGQHSSGTNRWRMPISEPFPTESVEDSEVASKENKLPPEGGVTTTPPGGGLMTPRGRSHDAGGAVSHRPGGGLMTPYPSDIRQLSVSEPSSTRASDDAESEVDTYVDVVLRDYQTLPLSTQPSRTDDEAQARAWFEARVPLKRVRAAVVVARARAPATVGSLRYLVPVLEQLAGAPPEYIDHLLTKGAAT